MWNREKVCNSKDKYIKSKCSEEISNIDPISTNNNKTELFMSFLSKRVHTLNVIKSNKALIKYFQLSKDQTYICQSLKLPKTK